MEAELIQTPLFLFRFHAIQQKAQIRANFKQKIFYNYLDKCSFVHYISSEQKSTSMKKQLTERQQEILTFIEQFRDANGYPPTLREIGKKFLISSTFGVKRHLDALVKKGYLNVESNASRGISFQRNDESESGYNNIVERNSHFNKIPIVGRVAAGSPILAVENIEGSVVVDPTFMKKTEDSFALRVKGDSMINAGIFENDLVTGARRRGPHPARGRRQRRHLIKKLRFKASEAYRH